MTEQTKAVVFSSDDGADWYVVEPRNVPEWLKNEDAMGYMLAGSVLSLGDGPPFYCAEAVH